MSESSTRQMDRRTGHRIAPGQKVRVARPVPLVPLADAEVLNISSQGVAIRTATALRPGERLSFSTNGNEPPILAEVLACDMLADGAYRVRCRCLMGSFPV